MPVVIQSLKLNLGCGGSECDCSKYGQEVNTWLAYVLGGRKVQRQALEWVARGELLARGAAV